MAEVESNIKATLNPNLICVCYMVRGMLVWRQDLGDDNRSPVFSQQRPFFFFSLLRKSVITVIILIIKLNLGEHRKLSLYPLAETLCRVSILDCLLFSIQTRQ